MFSYWKTVLLVIPVWFVAMILGLRSNAVFFFFCTIWCVIAAIALWRRGRCSAELKLGRAYAVYILGSVAAHFYEPFVLRVGETVRLSASIPFEGEWLDRVSHAALHFAFVGLVLIEVSVGMYFIALMFPEQARDFRTRVGEFWNDKRRREEFSLYLICGIAGIFLQLAGAGPRIAVVLSLAAFLGARYMFGLPFPLSTPRFFMNWGLALLEVWLVLPYLARGTERLAQLEQQMRLGELDAATYTELSLPHLIPQLLHLLFLFCYVLLWLWIGLRRRPNTSDTL